MKGYEPPINTYTDEIMCDVIFLNQIPTATYWCTPIVKRDGDVILRLKQILLSNITMIKIDKTNLIPCPYGLFSVMYFDTHRYLTATYSISLIFYILYNFPITFITFITLVIPSLTSNYDQYTQRLYLPTASILNSYCMLRFTFSIFLYLYYLIPLHFIPYCPHSIQVIDDYYPIQQKPSAHTILVNIHPPTFTS